jgi:hypothetical protein
VCATRSKVLPEGGKIEQVDFAPLVKKLSRSVELARVAGELHRDEIARSAWANVYPELSEGKPGLFGCVTGRGEAQILRLSLIYALLDGAKAIRAEHLLAALAVWQYCEASARYIFGDRLGFPEADRILGVLRNSQAGLTRTEIRDLFSRHQGGPQIDTALNYLAEHGLARRDVLDSGGRPTEVWRAIASPGGLGRDKSDQSDKSR